MLNDSIKDHTNSLSNTRLQQQPPWMAIGVETQPHTPYNPIAPPQDTQSLHAANTDDDEIFSQSLYNNDINFNDSSEIYYDDL